MICHIENNTRLRITVLKDAYTYDYFERLTSVNDEEWQEALPYTTA